MLDWIGMCAGLRSCTVRRLRCSVANDAIRSSGKLVIESRISHFITSTVGTKHNNAHVKFQNEKRQYIEYYNGGKVPAMRYCADGRNPENFRTHYMS